MSKIKVRASGDIDKTVEVRITGEITEQDGIWVSETINQKIKEGSINCSVYLNTIGGDVFAANEIANSISKFKGEIECEIGSICASAGTRIAAVCKIRKIAANGAIMIHKPQTDLWGNQDILNSRLKLLNNITQEYKTAYSKLTGLSEGQIEELWVVDYWMDAKEALDKKFVTQIIKNTPIDEDIYASLSNSNIPKGILRNFRTESARTIFDKSTRVQITSLLNLKSNASDLEISSEIQLRKVVIEQLEKNIKTKETKLEYLNEVKRQNAEHLIDSAISNLIIKESERNSFIALALVDYTDTKAILKALKPSKSKVNSGKSVSRFENFTYEDYMR